MKRFLILVAVLIVLAAGIPTIIAWDEAVTIAKFSKVQDSKPPLNTADVVKLLGQPSRIDESETTGVKGEVYYYPWHKNEMKIVFINDSVFHAEYTSEKKA